MPRLSRKNQITIPVNVLRKAGLEPGDELRVQAVGRGRVAVERSRDIIGEYAGALAFPAGHLDELRSEWER